MKVVNVFVVLTVLCLGAAGWWYAGSHVSDLVEGGFSGLVQMGEGALQGLLDGAGEAVSLPLS